MTRGEAESARAHLYMEGAGCMHLVGTRGEAESARAHLENERVLPKAEAGLRLNQSKAGKRDVGGRWAWGEGWAGTAAWL